MVLQVGLSPLSPMLPALVAAGVARPVTVAFAALGVLADQRALLP